MRISEELSNTVPPLLQPLPMFSPSSLSHICPCVTCELTAVIAHYTDVSFSKLPETDISLDDIEANRFSAQGLQALH